MKLISRILCPIDFSEPSMHAFRYAEELAIANEAQLVIAHAFDRPTTLDLPDQTDPADPKLKEKLYAVESTLPLERLFYDAVGFRMPLATLLRMSMLSTSLLALLSIANVRTRFVFSILMAVITIVILTNIVVMAAFGYISSEGLEDSDSFILHMDWGTFAAVSAGVCIVILVGSLYKIRTLSAGGKTVADALGGRLIPRNTQDLKQRKLLNVVEEMAIASGTPAPPVYLLPDEAGINAFAAGFSPRDAVIGVTQGTIDSCFRWSRKA